MKTMKVCCVLCIRIQVLRFAILHGQPCYVEMRRMNELQILHKFYENISFPLKPSREEINIITPPQLLSIASLKVIDPLAMCNAKEPSDFIYACSLRQFEYYFQKKGCTSMPSRTDGRPHCSKAEI